MFFFIMIVTIVINNEEKDFFLSTSLLTLEINVLQMCLQITRLYKGKEHVEVEFIVSF